MYNEFYGFSEKPFEMTPDPKFLYFTPSHRDALVSMLDAITHQKGFISLTGEVGTGKTTLIHLLLNKLDEKVKTAFIFHPSITLKDLLRNILLELGEEVREAKEKVLLSQLNEYLDRLAVGEMLAVMIDEAQHLPESVIDELGRLEEATPWMSKRLAVIFAGQPEFEEKLNSPILRPLKERIGTKCQIRALTEVESREYIDHRLKIVGSCGKEVFTPDAILMIIRYAQGIPRLINTLCDNAFLMGYGLSKKKVDEAIIGEVIKEIEGPAPPKPVPAKMALAVKGFHRKLSEFNPSRRRISLAILSLLCLGGFVWVYGSLRGSYQRKPANTWRIESILEQGVDRGTSLDKISPSTGPARTSKGSERPGGDSTSRGLPQPVTATSGSAVPNRDQDLLEEVITVREGRSISSLAQKYYHMTNPTLIDFILDFNPEINNAHLIRVNQNIKIPKISGEWLISSSGEHRFKIHVGTFWTPDFARPYKSEPALKGREIEVHPRRVSPQDTWYRVVIGNFANRDDALKMIDLLKGKGLLPLLGGTPKIG